jgi:hypothetical protein
MREKGRRAGLAAAESVVFWVIMSFGIHDLALRLQITGMSGKDGGFLE